MAELKVAIDGKVMGVVRGCDCDICRPFWALHPTFPKGCEELLAETQRLIREEDERQLREVQRRRAERLLIIQNAEAAEAKARLLLQSLLTKRQWSNYQRFKHFSVTGNVTGMKYRIHFGASGNVQRSDGRRYCCHSSDYNLPTADHMITQMLYIRHKEEHFLERAVVLR